MMNTAELARKLLEEQKALIALASLLEGLGDRLMGEWTIEAVDAVRGAGVLAHRVGEEVGRLYDQLVL